ncbi:NRDE family protein [Natronospira bacteriovora]|uniref:NRDE family protein n=1 Tax=Natronospira bacteriovora TaxID=3069753 RepID=A0ABU0W6R9_9GAMM|nr:NRDE family protein [Natronospira sp. AB-CW4]MDQ2069696.1 NRDE family protein [Natronospira sp. AB-CW4]
MCLLVVAWQSHPAIRLLAAGNRDEFHARPTEAAGFWPDHPELLAGRDVTAGGTWMGISRQGRFAAITNVRPGLGEDPGRPGRHSRGELPVDFLTSRHTTDDFLLDVQNRANDYDGFNLLVCDGEHLGYYSNRDGRAPQRLGPGVHALSNHRLETPWPKLLRLRSGFEAALQEGRLDSRHLLSLLKNSDTAEPGQLPDTGLDPELERRLSAAFVLGQDYGTRSSTLVWLHEDGHGEFLERRYGPYGQEQGDKVFRLTIESPPDD